MASEWAAGFNLVLQAVRFTWDVVRSFRRDEDDHNHRIGINSLLDGSLHLRRYARALDDYCDAASSPEQSITEESALLMDALSERAHLADYFGGPAFRAVVACVPGANQSDALQAGWFQRRAFHNWVRAAQLYGDRIHGVTPEHVKLLEKISESHWQYERDYAVNSAGDDGPLAPFPELLPDEVVIGDLRRTAQAARDFAKEIDKIIRENWTVKDALSEARR